MSFQTFVTERLAAITAQLNAIAANAKKIFELPVQSTLDPTSKIHVSRGGTSESLEIQKIIDAIAQGNFSQLLSVGEISVTGLVISVPSGAQWVYENVNYATAAVTNITTTLCATGFLRQDILVANQLNQIVLIKGAESETIRIRPNIPVGSVLVTEIDVDDTVVGTPSDPIIGSNYITKREKTPFHVYQSGEIDNTYLDDFYYGYLNFRDVVTNLKSIQVYTNVHLYSGKEILVKNSQATDITIFHLNGLGFQFSFPNEQNLVLKPNEIIRFSVKITDPSSGILEYVGRLTEVPTVAVSDVVGLLEALAAKLDASAYNQHFKGKYTSSGALTTAHPTATDGDYAIVDAGTGVDAKEWIWDNEAGWIVGGAIGASTTDALSEGSTNLYHTSARVLATLLTGISFVTGGAIVSTDSILVAFGKLQKQISDFNTTANIKSLLGITTLSGSNTGDQDLSSYAHISVTPIEIGTATTLSSTHNGAPLIITASCTITIPNGLAAGFNCSFITLAGVTLTIALGGSVVLFNNVGLTMAEKLSFTLQARTTTNNYITAGSL